MNKACEYCREERILLGQNFFKISKYRRFFGTLLIYLPLFFVPFVIPIAILSWASLKTIGAQNLKSYWDFIPNWNSHRYRNSDHIVQNWHLFKPQLSSRWFWIFNCKFYCPFSVALFEYTSYLVKAVENWWCPFFHSRKTDYAGSSIDLSFWHGKADEVGKLHPDDRNNPIWNSSSNQPDSTDLLNP